MATFFITAADEKIECENLSDIDYGIRTQE